jgi:hypothetical protein
VAVLAELVVVDGYTLPAMFTLKKKTEPLTVSCLNRMMNNEV